MSFPSINKALELTAFGAPLKPLELPIPEATSGSVVTRVLAAPIVPYTYYVHSGIIHQLKLKPPFIPNSASIGRVHSVGPDAVRLKPGDLVFIKSQIHARDYPQAKVVPGHINGASPEAQKLMDGEFGSGAFQQYQKVPMENCLKLDESRLCNALGYTPAILQSLTMYTVAAGAIIEAADLKAAETIVIGPSGGAFSGLAVEVALALGANVIALGRNEKKLADFKKTVNNPRLQYVVMTGDDDVDTAAILAKTPDGEGAEVFNDWTPGECSEALWLGPGSRVLKLGGRIVLSGGTPGGLGAINYAEAGFKDLLIISKWVCNRATTERLISIITQGFLKIGAESGTRVKVYGLDKAAEAIEYAKDNGGWRHYTVMSP
ncbi:isopropanol dehydrogenase [Colletotrichum truncatum]|uniref:Isopropanol dehydrogenase n=1 Tax=Colletotrichum truncatum TaxID=5467 RepID=A0ACC3Z3C9_COLTU|nr:isopropanol dehydrogenase [Colletotrichum truncatum]KAF6793087.1 isopropanol dehydrogenase [Colletotrichum truncatum]